MTVDQNRGGEVGSQHSAAEPTRDDAVSSGSDVDSSSDSGSDTNSETNSTLDGNPSTLGYSIAELRV